MSHIRCTIVLAALALAACAAQPPDRPAAIPTAAAPTSAMAGVPAAMAPTSLPTATAAPTSLPTATAAPTSLPTATAPAAPTAQLILPPTEQPVPASQPVAAAAPTPFFRAEPTATPPAAPQPKPAQSPVGKPTRLVIKSIGLDYRPVSVGLDKHRVPIVPDHDVGWYNLSASPGQGENIVLWGHVLRFRQTPRIPAPFARMKELKPGARVVLYDRAGKPHTYAITKQVWVTPDQVEYILPQGQEMITMVSCIGDKVIQNGEVVDESHRLITIAEPAS